MLVFCDWLSETKMKDDFYSFIIFHFHNQPTTRLESIGRKSSSTYIIQPRGWVVITMKDNKTIEIVFLKNE
jgi:hypothetical protein